MVGDLGDFRTQVNKTMKDTLSNYTPVIKTALEPAMVATKAQVNDREQDNQKIENAQEQEIV